MSNDQQSQTVDPVPTGTGKDSWKGKLISAGTPKPAQATAKTPAKPPALQPTPQPPAGAPAQSWKSKLVGDPLAAPPTTDTENSKDAPQEKSYFARAWNWLNTNPIKNREWTQKAIGYAIPGVGGDLPNIIKGFRAKEEQSIKQGHPVRAALYQAAAGVPEDESNMIHDSLTPLSAGLAIATLGESLVGEYFVGGAEAAKGMSAAQKFAKVPGYIRIPYKLGQAGLGAYFGAQGLEGMATPKQPGESAADYAARVAKSGSQAALSGAGEMSVGKEFLRSSLRDVFKLNDNLATMVSDRLEKLYKTQAEGAKDVADIREEEAQRKRGIETKKVSAVGAAEIDLENALSALEADKTGGEANILRSADKQVAEVQQHLGKLDEAKTQTAKKIIVDTAHILADENKRLSAEFEDIDTEVSKKVPQIADKATVYSLISKQFEEYALNDEQLPSGVKKVIGKPAEGEAMTYQGHELNPDRPGDARLIAELKKQGAFKETSGAEDQLSMRQLTNIKRSLYTAGYRETSGPLRNALMGAADDVSKIQEKAAKQAGEDVGKRYATAKKDYTQFMRGINSPVMQDWLHAQDMEDQMLAKRLGDETFGKTTKIESGEKAAALREIMQSVGLDTAGFDKLIGDSKAAESRLTEIPKEAEHQLDVRGKGIKKQAMRERASFGEAKTKAQQTARQEHSALDSEISQRVASSEKATKEKVTDLEGEGEIIPGKKTSELAGLPKDELERQRIMTAISKSAAGNGVTRLGHLAMALYGLMDIVHGKKWGFGMLGYAVSREAIPGMVKNRAFQDWLIEKAGVDPSDTQTVSKLRRGIEKLGPILQKAARSQAPEAGLGANKELRSSDPSKSLEPLPEGTGGYTKTPSIEDLEATPQ